MNCIRIALYDITSGTYDEIVGLAKTGMVPLFEQSPGFVSYGVAQIDDTAFVSLSTWLNRLTSSPGWALASRNRNRFEVGLRSRTGVPGGSASYCARSAATSAECRSEIAVPPAWLPTATDSIGPGAPRHLGIT